MFNEAHVHKTKQLSAVKVKAESSKWHHFLDLYVSFLEYFKTAWNI